MLHHVASNGLSHTCTADDEFLFSIAGPATVLANTTVDDSVRTVTFKARKAGTYIITVRFFLPHGINPRRPGQ